MKLQVHPNMRVIFAAGSLGQLGELAREHHFRRTLIVSDAGIVAAGYAARAMDLLQRAGISSCVFDGFSENPDTAAVARGRAFAAKEGVDSILGLGGGSSLDCARGINFILTNGGQLGDYRGYGKAAQPMLPMIGIPTTTGTGSEAQSYAVIADAASKMKMACGDPMALCRAVLLDSELACSQPRAVRAAAGFDAIAHAVETWVTRKRTPASDDLSARAWTQLAANYERFLDAHGDEALLRAGAMLLGAHLAGAAIENSMLGAAHACANPLTARFDITHGVALALLLPHVVRWNAAAPEAEGEAIRARYAEMAGIAGSPAGAVDGAVERLAQRLEAFALAGGFPESLEDAGVVRESLPELAALAATQWTGTFNPRAFDERGALEIYQAAW